MKKVPGLNIYDTDRFYYVLAFHSKNRESLDEWMQSFAELHEDIVEYYSHVTIKDNTSGEYFSKIVILLDEYKENLFDFENELQAAGRIDVQFDFRIMTKDDLVIYDNNLYSRFLGPKHYILAMVKDNFEYDCEVYDSYNEILEALYLTIPKEVIDRLTKVDTLAEKNEILHDYYELNNPEVRLYLMMSDKNYLEFFFGGH